MNTHPVISIKTKSCDVVPSKSGLRTILNLSHLLSVFGGCVFLALGIASAHAVGAVTTFTTVEAESGTLAGGATISSFVPGSTVPSVATPQLEASGKAYVELNATGESVSIVNPVDGANTIVVRCSIPDAANGGGTTATLGLYVGGTLRQTLTLSSKQSWVYRGATTTPDDPNAGGMAYKFYNEDRAFITGAAIPSGTVIKLQKDSGNSASFYRIDCVDFEKVDAAKTQPANSLSITASPYNADPTFTTDATTAIKNCINDARTQGKSVWIPQGKFMLNHLASGGLDITGVTVNGAGVWYSTLYRNIPIPVTAPYRSNIHLGTNSVIRDVFIDSNAIYKAIGGASGDDYGVTSSGDNWLVERIWVQHCDANWMSGHNGTIKDSRVADGWGDGINLNNGNAANGSLLGYNLTMTNCFIRNSGDDGLAIYSDSGTAGTNPKMHDCRIVNNTVVSPFWANGIGLYGGTNMFIQNNLVLDCGCNSGMAITTFGSTGHPLDKATVTGNTVIRCGGWNGTDRHDISINSPSGQYTVAIVENNVARDALRAGIKIGGALEKLTVGYNVVDHPATKGIWVESSGVTGTGTINYNSVLDLNAGQAAYQNDAAGTFTPTLTGNSWQSGPGAGVVFYQNTTYTGAAGLPLTAGNYTLAQLAAMNVPNDWASSMTLPPGWTVTAYSGDNFTGTSWVLTTNVPSFLTLPPSANDQMSSCKIVGPEDGVVYHLVCQKSAMSLDNNNSVTAGTSVIQWPDSLNNANQEWQLVDVGGGYWNLLCQKSQMDLDNGGSTTTGTPVVQYSIRTNNNQHWQVSSRGGGYYHLICQTSGMALDNGGATTNSAVMTQWTDHGSTDPNVANQNWTLEFVR